MTDKPSCWSSNSSSIYLDLIKVEFEGLDAVVLSRVEVQN